MIVERRFITEVAAHKMPATERDLWDLFCNFPHPITAVIERVHAMPKQGVRSVWTFGQNYGMLRAFLIAQGITFDEVLPRKWQQSLGLTRKKTESPTQWKNRLKAKAQQLFPSLHVTLATADALLIVECLRRSKR